MNSAVAVQLESAAMALHTAEPVTVHRIVMLWPCVEDIAILVGPYLAA